MNSITSRLVAAAALAIGASNLLAQPAGSGPGVEPGNSAPATAPAVDPNKVVLTAGEEQITAGQFEAFIRMLPEEVRMGAAGPGGKRSIAEQLVKVKLTAALARKKGIDKQPDFQLQMDMLREQLLTSLYLDEALVSDADVEKFYNDNKDRFMRVQARHILIGAGRERGDKEAKAKADEVRKRLEKEDFAAVAKTESDDPGSGEDGGELPPFGKGQMMPEFEKSAFELKIDQISDPVKTNYGYHIIQVRKRETAPLAELRGQIKARLKDEKIDEFFEQLQKEAKPVFDEEYFGKPPMAPLGLEGMRE